MEKKYQELICRYLLGQLSDDEQAELEEQYFADDELFEQLLVVEDELIDGYARGELCEQERASLEEYFLRSQPRRKRLMLVQALMNYIASLSEDVNRQRNSWWDELKSLLHIKSR